MNQNITTSWKEEIVSEDFIKKLVSFTRSCAYYRPSLRNGLPRGFQFHDIVLELLTQYMILHYNNLDHEITKEQLEALIQDQIRNRLRDLSRKPDNKHDSVNPEDERLVAEEENILSGINVSQLAGEIMSSISGHPDLEQLFIDLYIDEHSRKALIEKYNIPPNEYDNMAKRLRRIVLPLITKYQLIRNNERSRQNDPFTKRA